MLEEEVLRRVPEALDDRCVYGQSGCLEFIREPRYRDPLVAVDSRYPVRTIEVTCLGRVENDRHLIEQGKMDILRAQGCPK